MAARRASLASARDLRSSASMACLEPESLASGALHSGQRFAKPGPYALGDRLPDRPFPDILDIAQNVVEHAVRLCARRRPIFGVEGEARGAIHGR